MSNRRQRAAREQRRALRAETARRNAQRRRRAVWSLSGAGVVVLVAALVLLVVAVVRGSGSAPPPVTADDPVLGQRSAPVTIIEYGDYKCPFCTRFAIQTAPQLISEFVDTGKVRLVWRDFVNIDAESESAAEAARCAGAQHHYWDYHDALYHYTWDNYYSRGVNAEGARAFTGHYDQLAARLGLDVAEFRACRQGGGYRSAISAAHDAGTAHGVTGTPTFFINGQRVVGAQPYDVFRRLIQADLAGG